MAKKKIPVFTAKYQYLFHTCISSNIYVLVLMIFQRELAAKQIDSSQFCFVGHFIVPFIVRTGFEKDTKIVLALIGSYSFIRARLKQERRVYKQS